MRWWEGADCISTRKFGQSVKLAGTFIPSCILNVCWEVLTEVGINWQGEAFGQFFDDRSKILPFSTGILPKSFKNRGEMANLLLSRSQVTCRIIRMAVSTLWRINGFKYIY